MKLTKQNFLSHFDGGYKFYIAGQQRIDTCYPIQTDGLSNGFSAFRIENKVIQFHRDHLIFTEYARDVFVDSVFSDRIEAISKMREMFLQLIDHFNNHEFKNCKIKAE